MSDIANNTGDSRGDSVPTINGVTINETQNALFSSLYQYPFDTDEAFLAGLSHIFGHPSVPVSEAELAQKSDVVLKAKCFYYNRTHLNSSPIDPSAYQAWLDALTPPSPEAIDSIVTGAPSNPEAHSSRVTANVDSTQSSTTTTQQPPSVVEPAESASPPAGQPPPYPTSFAAIVDLITNNKPVPGIEEIPTTVLESGSSKQDKAVRRRKPWETQGDSSAPPASVEEKLIVDSNITNATETYGQVHDSLQSNRDGGLLRLLRPDAVPDSGLIAKE